MYLSLWILLCVDNSASRLTRRERTHYQAAQRTGTVELSIRGRQEICFAIGSNGCRIISPWLSTAVLYNVLSTNFFFFQVPVSMTSPRERERDTVPRGTAPDPRRAPRASDLSTVFFFLLSFFPSRSPSIVHGVVPFCLSRRPRFRPRARRKFRGQSAPREFSRRGSRARMADLVLRAVIKLALAGFVGTGVSVAVPPDLCYTPGFLGLRLFLALVSPRNGFVVMMMIIRVW